MVRVISLCLNSRYRLRTQMMLAFGSTAVIALSAFTIIGLYTAYNAGESVSQQARDVVEDLVKHSLASTAEYVAGTMTKKFNNIGGAGSLMAEATRDRFVGYPNMVGWEDDKYVPFPDRISGRNIYPIEGFDLPLDWNITMNLDATNAEEHLPRRPLGWYSPEKTLVSTENAAYFMQGGCDPSQNDNPQSPTHYPNCTAANNDVYRGGAVRPTRTNFFLYDKAKDIAFLLKALFEIHTDVKTMGVFFANDGAGSTLQYPAVQYDGTGTYTSIGCEWMYTPHPRTNQFIASRTMIANCHDKGHVAPMREYNPLERGWCRDQVERDMALSQQQLSPAAHNIMSTGPYLDVLSAERLWVLTFGQAVFDKVSHEFIACTVVDVSILQLYDILLGSSDVGTSSEAALVRWDDRGTVLVASQWDPRVETENAYVTDADNDLKLGLTAATYGAIRSLVDYSQPWDPKEVKQKYYDTAIESNGRLIMMHPIPTVPDAYDPVWVPQYLVIVTIDVTEAYGLLNAMDDIINDDVKASWERIGTIVGIGFGVVIISIVYISLTLVKPLRWMQKVAGMIISNAGNAGGKELKIGLLEELDHNDARQFCAPRTEVTKLLKEFDKMIRDFSGDGAAEVAGQTVNEVKNTFEWRRLYEDIYPWETFDDEGGRVPGTTIPRSLSITKTSYNNSKEQDFEDELTTDSTMRTQGSIFSTIRESITNSQYHPTVEAAMTRGSSLYSSVRDVAFSVGTKYGVIKEVEEERVDGPPFVNRGENIVHPKEEAMEDYFDGVANEHSYLFWWTTLLVGSPILVTAILISVSVANATTELIPIWLQDVRERSYVIESEAIVTANNARAFFGDEVMSRFVRDLHIYSRLAGWLLFGAMNRANSFTDTFNGGYECKNYAKGSASLEEPDICPFFLDLNNTVCDCEWGESRESIPCTSFPNDAFPTTTNTRPFQQRFVEGQADDVDANGTRMTTTFPEVGVHPSASKWWNLQEIETLPGYSVGNRGNGHATTYDRVRVASAMAPGEFAIYNYNPGIGEQTLIGSFIGFERDGMMTGWGGCSHGHVEYPHLQANAAAEALRPSLCPESKFGYDSRCRSWYDEGMKDGGVYITAPYRFANSDIFAGSATFSLIDPVTKEHVGQTLIDFLPDAFMSALDAENTQIGHGTSGFPIVITPTVGSNGGDTLIGPGFSLKKPASIGSVVLPFDDPGSPNRIAFETNVADKMRAGERGNATFTRSKNEKGAQEDVYMSYAPVEASTLLPVNSSDFSEGVIAKTTLVYSIGFGITVDDLELPFQQVEDKVNAEINRANYISLALIIAAFTAVIYMTYTMCLAISQPIIVLISIVKMIESKQLQDELPKLNGGSCEIYDVYDSLEKLCKIVRFSNAAFFKGDRARSYRVLEDALELFVNMGNQKALGVANNNLGTMVLLEQMERSSATGDEVYFAGVKYFDEAIRIGTFEYQNADFDDDRGDFVKQLANRYFNRGMFYIINRNHPNATGDMQATGTKDLNRARSLDEEAYLMWRERGQLLVQARSEFGCLIRRARGMLTLVKEAEFKDIWGIETLIEKGDRMLRDPDLANSSLFEGVSFVARQQQITDLRMQYALMKNDLDSAARMAIRILVRDEYVIDTVIMNCVTTLNRHYAAQGLAIQVPNLAQGVKRETRRGAVDSMREAKNVVFCLDYSGSMAGERIERASKNLLWVYEEHCLDKDSVGFVRFNHAVDEKLYFDLGRKGENQDEHEAILQQATDAEGGTRLYAALHKCVAMAQKVDNRYDCWIIALTDGESSWDFPAKQVISQIEKHNKKGGAKIHVVVIGFEVGSEVAESVQQITKITDKSLYIDARGGGLDEMDNAFEQVAAVITGNAITMETF